MNFLGYDVIILRFFVKDNDPSEEIFQGPNPLYRGIKWKKKSLTKIKSRSERGALTNKAKNRHGITY